MRYAPPITAEALRLVTAVAARVEEAREQVTRGPALVLPQFPHPSGKQRVARVRERELSARTTNRERSRSRWAGDGDGQERRLRMVLSVSATCRGMARNQGCGTCEASGAAKDRGLLGGLGADLGRPLWLSLARWAGLRFCRQPAFGAALPRRAKENAGGIHRRLVSGENPGEDWRIDRSSSGSLASSLT